MNRDSIITGKDHSIQIDEWWLSPARSQKVHNHSPDGFSWGYGGSGPSQLALALLLEVTDEGTAVANYQAFKFDVIAGLDEIFTLNARVIYDWLEKNVKLPYLVDEGGKNV